MPTTSISENEEFYVRLALLSTAMCTKAVRFSFNLCFPPKNLQYILNQQQSILLDLKTKGVINEKQQWDLMFPLNGDANSDTFDLTLMICLIKNLEPATKLAEDLELIIRFRNEVAHLCDIEIIDNTYFSETFDDISDAVGRLGGQSMLQECKDLKTKILDQSYHKVMVIIEKALVEFIEEINKYTFVEQNVEEFIDLKDSCRKKAPVNNAQETTRKDSSVYVPSGSSSEFRQPNLATNAPPLQPGDSKDSQIGSIRPTSQYPSVPSDISPAEQNSDNSWENLPKPSSSSKPVSEEIMNIFMLLEELKGAVKKLINSKIVQGHVIPSGDRLKSPAAKSDNSTHSLSSVSTPKGSLQGVVFNEAADKQQTSRTYAKVTAEPAQTPSLPKVKATTKNPTPSCSKGAQDSKIVQGHVIPSGDRLNSPAAKSDNSTHSLSSVSTPKGSPQGVVFNEAADKQQTSRTYAKVTAEPAQTPSLPKVKATTKNPTPSCSKGAQDSKIVQGHVIPSGDRLKSPAAKSDNSTHSLSSVSTPKGSPQGVVFNEAADKQQTSRTYAKVTPGPAQTPSLPKVKATTGNPMPSCSKGAQGDRLNSPAAKSVNSTRSLSSVPNPKGSPQGVVFNEAADKQQTSITNAKVTAEPAQTSSLPKVKATTKNPIPSCSKGAQAGTRAETTKQSVGKKKKGKKTVLLATSMARRGR